MNILLVGGSGFIGTTLAATLIDRDHDVTVLARTPSESELPDGVETAVGDVTAHDSIAPAFEGMDCVVNLVALSPLFKPSGGSEQHFKVHLGGTENVVAAAEEHEVKRIVQMSALGADPHGETAYIKSKGQAEIAVRNAEMEHVIIRPSIVFGEGGEFVSFTEMLTTPVVTALPGGGTTRFQPIWVDDLTEMLAAAIENDDHADETYELGGPEVLSLADVTELVARSNGHSVTIVPIPMALVTTGLSLIDPIPGAPMGADQAESLKMDNVAADNDIEAFGIAPDELRTLESYLGLSTPGESNTPIG
ncbi:complex I NDUFA9 subunit family protein [Halocatena pleomorpha]|uniref:Complex I NDUFA9 subunit family protein n=1 Tax=Halocatena pleomorpha TaxID=1785090 RepID=A0A3P3R2E0_9EURY|nr:complex I NDUFA9 subunit family protein [Halocatena pleomorpha]RRJ27627.1 complex I NDUFA9 subunit family protein [Halocatena pleomorpha]